MNLQTDFYYKLSLFSVCYTLSSRHVCQLQCPKNTHGCCTCRFIRSTKESQISNSKKTDGHIPPAADRVLAHRLDVAMSYVSIDLQLQLI